MDGCAGGERLFFQGLIQVAIGCYHLTTANLAGADHLLGRGIPKLEPYAPRHRDVDVHGLVAETRALHERVRRARSAEGPEPEGFPRIRRERRED